MTAFSDNIEKLTLENSFFRKVIFTGKFAQLVLMCLKPGEEIGMEVHDTVDQFFRIEQGEAEFTIDGSTYKAVDASAVIVPAGSNHNVKNISADTDLKLYTIYSPPNHPDGTIHQTKEEALKAEEH